MFRSLLPCPEHLVSLPIFRNMITYLELLVSLSILRNLVTCPEHLVSIPMLRSLVNEAPIYWEGYKVFRTCIENSKYWE
jgi:Leucine-rich repeat (LRR) protein